MGGDLAWHCPGKNDHQLHFIANNSLNMIISYFYMLNNFLNHFPDGDDINLRYRLIYNIYYP